MSFLLSLSLILRRRMDLMVFLLRFSKRASELAPCLGKLFRLWVSTSTFPSCWKRALIQPVPKKGAPFQPSTYRPISLTSVLSKVFESILNRKIWKHLKSSILISDRQYGFLKERSTGDLLSLLSDSWSSALRGFGVSFAVALHFLHSLILSLSNSPAPGLTAMLTLTRTLLVKSGTHSLYLPTSFDLHTFKRR